jgi:2'-5' RNA ligase
MGSFGSKKPHAVFAGVTPAPEMYALQAEIERICQRLGLPADPRKFTPHVTLARLRNARTEDVAHYLSGRGNFHTAPFTVNRFVLMSSKESVGGGPYLTEEVFPLYEAGGASDAASLHDHLA